MHTFLTETSKILVVFILQFLASSYSYFIRGHPFSTYVKYENPAHRKVN